jgi:D-glycero-D-manno-heptose 1,7-bisphosphate phosphatase
MRRGLFLDRDGTIIVDTGFVSRPSDVILLPGIGGVLRAADALGFVLVVISNQSGVGRGMFDQRAVVAVDDEMRRQLALERVELASPSYYCYDSPEVGCNCRKPSPQLLQRAAADHGIDLAASVMMGDRQSDVEAGLNAGCRAVALGFDPVGVNAIRIEDLAELVSVLNGLAVDA